MIARRPWLPIGKPAGMPRAMKITDKGLAAIRRSRPVEVPLLAIPLRPDWKDKRR